MRAKPKTKRKSVKRPTSKAIVPPTTAAAPEADKSRHLTVVAAKGEKAADTLARVVIAPEIQAAVTLQEFDSPKFQGLTLDALVENLGRQTRAVNDGDLKRCEGMLTAQAHTLDALFHTLARRSLINMDQGEFLHAADTYMRLALRAQSQARATIETLGQLKNPAPVAFIRQANVAHGPQQVNNGTQPSPEAPRARENETPQNKLLEEQHGERLDTGATATTGGANSPVEAVATRNGPADGSGKG